MGEVKNRIELHFHSKAGGNATMYPGEIIRHLSDIGMPAFAIMDESNVGAFPELETVWETGKYTARPIYGMEAMVKGINDEVDYISVLIKNEQGKRKLFKLISENESIEPYQLFEFENFINDRDGFLVGSGNEKGRLYKLAIQGAKEAKLRSEISTYDYIEVLPGKQYEAINKVIIRISDELDIPVVAISDARYIDSIGRKALNILKHWNKEAEIGNGNLLLTTEEMLDAFAYLPSEKAYEIVVENTYRIAHMCQTISVCPTEKFYPAIPDAAKRIKEKCYAALAKKYDVGNKAAKERLDWELEALGKTEMESYVLQINELLNKAGLKAADNAHRGAAAGSIVAYLLDICEIDPLAYGLEPEIIFGANGQRAIDININLPANMQLDVISKIPEVEGVGKYVWAGTVRSISQTFAKVMVERYMEDSERYIEEDEYNKLIWLIEGNYLGRGKHPGGIVVFPDGCNYSELTPIAKVDGNFEITYFDYHSIDRAFIKYNLLKHDIPEMLVELSRMTGVDLSTIPFDIEEVMALFEVDSEGNLAGCDGLPEFKHEYVRNIIKELKPKSFNELVKISAIAHGTCTWENNGEILAKEKGIGIKDIIATRDDVFEYILSLGIDRSTAFEIAEAVRKGIVSRSKNSKWQSWKKELIEAGAPEWYIWSCEQIRYLFPRAHAISYMIMNLKLGWFKVHFPDEFIHVQKSYSELS